MAHGDQWSPQLAADQVRGPGGTVKECAECSETVSLQTVGWQQELRMAPPSWNQVRFFRWKPQCCMPSVPGQADQTVAPAVSFGSSVMGSPSIGMYPSGILRVIIAIIFFSLSSCLNVSCK